MSDDADPDFDRLMRGLTEAQRNVLGRVAINQDLGLHPKPVQALMDKGLIERTEQILGNGLPVRVYRYHVPLPMHMRWCNWCTRWGRSR